MARSFQTSDGTNIGHFDPKDWLLLISVAAIWGSSFLWIAIGLDGFHPGAIAFVRVLFGAAALWLYGPARQPVDRAAWPAITIVAIAGNAAPAVLFPFAQQRVASSVAGMLNSLSPFMVLGIAMLMTRSAPRRRQVVGLAIGLVGALMMAAPTLVGVDAEPLGVLLVMFAVAGYAITNNVIPPLQQLYGGPAILARALTISTVVLTPYGVYGLANSSGGLVPWLALLILGVVCTGIARALFATLIGSVGAPRSSIIGYLVPIFAITLGVLVRNERVGIVEIAGTAVVLFGAWVISRQNS